MAATKSDAQGNRLLAALPAGDLERWLPNLCPLTLATGQVLQGPAASDRFAYFPLDCAVSLQVHTGDGHCDEVAIVGRDGMIGAALLGGASGLTRAVVHSPGRALRMDAGECRAELGRSLSVARLLLGFVLAQNAQVSQGVACGRHHSIEQRLCRRLLQGMELQQGGRLLMTHEQLALLLGVRRESVTVEACKLQAARVIRYSRGSITVLDRGELERRACECIAVIRLAREGAQAPAAWLPGPRLRLDSGRAIRIGGAPVRRAGAALKLSHAAAAAAARG